MADSSFFVEKHKVYNFWDFMFFTMELYINRNIMKENLLLYARLSLQITVVESHKIFLSYVKHFWIFQREWNCRILTGLCK